MGSEYILGPSGELYHSGIKGMKWGIRRYQNKDGSLTPAGRKRYNAEVAKLKDREKTIKGQERAKARQAKLDAKKAELDARERALRGETDAAKKYTKVKSADSSKKKNVKDMTDDELRAETSRMQAEAQYLNAQRQLVAMTPQKVSMGKKFAEGFVNSVVPKLTNAAADMAAKYVTKKVGDALGLEKKEVESVYDKAKKEAEYWKNLNTATQQKKQYERGKQDDKDEADRASEAAKKAKQDAANAERDKKVEEDIDRRMNDIDNKNAKEKAEREKPLEGEVIGNGTSRKSSEKTNTKKTDPVIIDMETYANDVALGRYYVNQYLLTDGDDK